MITPTTPSSDRIAQRDRAHTPALPVLHHRSSAGVCWGSVLAGAIIAFATQIVLTLVGIAIGLATLHPANANSPSGTALSSGAGIWLVLTTLIALFVGGYIAARLAGRLNGWLHGLTTWGTLSLATLLLLATAGGQLIGAASGLTNFAVSNSDKASQVQLPPAVQQQLDSLKAQAGQTADQGTTQAQATDPQTREAQARDVAQKAAKGGAVGSGVAAFAMILGAIAAVIGGKVGQRAPRFEFNDVEPEYTNEQATGRRA